MPDPEDPGLTQSFDLIYKGLEITTGSQRIHDYEMLRQNIIKFGLDRVLLLYLESFRYGMPPRRLCHRPGKAYDEAAGSGQHKGGGAVPERHKELEP